MLVGTMLVGRLGVLAWSGLWQSCVVVIRSLGKHRSRSSLVPVLNNNATTTTNNNDNDSTNNDHTYIITVITHMITIVVLLLFIICAACPPLSLQLSIHNLGHYS